MPGAPTTGQLALLIVAIAVFAIGGVVSLARLHRDRNELRLASKIATYVGLVLLLIVVVWHSTQRGSWIPIGDNFDALIWLAILLAGFVQYIQRARSLAGLDWFVMPIVLLLLIGAAVLGTQDYLTYGHNAWLLVHRITSYVGAIAFAIAAATGAMYLLAARKLRRKQIPSGPPMGSLERLEHLTMVAVTLGFALLTVGVVTGVVYWLAEQQRPHTGKVFLSGLAWLVYAVMLHSPINPRLRGRRMAMLSISGFVLMLATLVAVAIMSGAKA